MDQERINRQEWSNPERWSGPDWMALYFSKKDARIWVRKRIPRMGWTLNLGRTSGVVWLIFIVGAVPVLITGAALILFWLWH